MTDKTRSQLVLGLVVLFGGGGGVLLSMPAIPGPPVEMCFNQVTGGGNVRLTPAEGGYMYAALRLSDGSKNLIYEAKGRMDKLTPVDIGPIANGQEVHFMLSRAPLADPKSAIFNEDDNVDYPVAIQLSPTETTWEQVGRLENNCYRVNFARRPMGWRYALHLNISP